MRTKADLRRKTLSVDERLARAYGREELSSRMDDPVDTLVETILSQNTTDSNSHRAFLALKSAYPKWEPLLTEKPATVARIIRSGGLAGLKADRIISSLQYIERARGRIELDFLRGISTTEADAWLAQMKGVGPKTRAIVLLFSLGMPTFPVDTHVHRVSRRIGLIGVRTTRAAAQDELAGLVPRARYYSFHINLIKHGRAVCKARNPRCDDCQVRRLCDHIGSAGKAQS
ncbi:MAG: endonuclease III [Thermoplasmata archaeon]|jgi:endonuclease-3|nr:endonuclease III [Thermoplasmata archaeon]